MKLFTVSVFALLFFTSLYGQNSKEEQAVVAEGKMLYRSEMASWYGTDLFIERFPDLQPQAGGYFSYADKEMEKCVFFSNTEEPKIIATITFDSTYNMKTATVDVTERPLTEMEKDIYSIRKAALADVKSDTSYKHYKNSNFNLIPLISGNSKKVFILTGPTQRNVVLFGNDYLLTFNKDNKLVSKKQLHRNLIPIQYTDDGKMEGGGDVESSAHTHLPETGELITSTDICTLMLYGKFAKWKSHMVAGKKMVSIWNCQTNTLAVISKDVLEKINKDQKKRKGN